MQLAFNKLPYAYDALEPHMSRATLQVHHDRHHRGYVEKAKTLAKGLRMDGLSLEQIIVTASRQRHHDQLLGNAAQVWNHAFFWRSLRPGGGGRPDGKIAARIDASFGGYDAFLEQFIAAATGLFGSGWVWLVIEGSGLAIMTTPNGDTPIAKGVSPLLTVDVWEHAYYLDYQNRRADFVEMVMTQLINWDFATANLARPRGISNGLDPRVGPMRKNAGA